MIDGKIDGIINVVIDGTRNGVLAIILSIIPSGIGRCTIELLYRSSPHENHGLWVIHMYDRDNGHTLCLGAHGCIHT